MKNENKEPARTSPGTQFESLRGLQSDYARYMDAAAQKVRPDDEETTPPKLDDWSGAEVDPINPNEPVDTSKPGDWSTTGEG